LATTTNYGFYLPTASSRGWNTLLNENLTTLDTKLGEILATRRATEVLLNTMGGTVALPRGFNMGFDFWQRGTSGFATNGFTADQWELEISAGSPVVARLSGGSTDNFKYGASVTVTNGDTALLHNYIPYKPAYSDFFRFCRGKAVTAACDLYRSNGSSTVRVGIYDGVGTSWSSYVSGTAAFERLVVNRTIDASATTLRMTVEVVGTNASVARIANAAFSLGTTASLAYEPINAQEDFFGCCGQYQIVDVDISWNYSTSATSIMKKAFFYPCPMIATPTSVVVTPGSMIGGTITVAFVAVDRMGGYIKGTGITKTATTVGAHGNVVELEVT